MQKLATLLLLISLLGFAGCKPDETPVIPTPTLDDELTNILNIASETGNASYFIQPQSDDFDAIPQDPRNPLTEEKIALGKLLFHETGLALDPRDEQGMGTYSCASCHFAAAGFQAGRHQGIGEGGIGIGVSGEGREISPDYQIFNLDAQPIRTPSVINTAFQEVMLWNGQFGALGINQSTDYAWVGDVRENNNLGYSGVEVQAIAAIDVHKQAVEEDFILNNGYQELFAAAFPQIEELERYTDEYAGLAIAAYERTMFSNQAPFQRYLKGEINAMSEQEKRGAMVFFDKGKCGSCHNGPGLNSLAFYGLGMLDLFASELPVFKTPVDAPENRGRGGFTANPEDNYKFKVPQLYNLADSPFYGHGSSFYSIREVLEYKNNAISQNPEVPESQLAEEFVPLGLTDAELDDLEAFLTTALRDPDLARYAPESLPSGNCFPNADAVSVADLGCE
jgi:cytochrome c peroxidase